MMEQGQFVFMGTVDEFNNYVAPTTLVVELVKPPSINELKMLQGVEDVEHLNENRFRVKFSDAREVVQRIVKTSVEHDWQLIEIVVEKSSLESIFAALSKVPNHPLINQES
jgi:ABC-2 type transport system ATP-binding protein